jgi:MoxR-like ATPase
MTKKMENQNQTQTKPSRTQDLEKGFSSKNLFLLERDKELKQLMYAMLIGEHVFLQGDAGTGKSMLAKHAFNLVQNAKLFSIQMSEATLSEHLFGAYDIPTWKDKGFLMRDITGSILEADFAFIDEIFDGREDVLRTLLGILNERKFIEGRQQEDAMLHTAVATANYQSINEKTIPILDRFLFKSIVKPLKSKSNKLKMYSQHLAKAGGKLASYPIKPILDLKQLKDFTDKVYSDEVIISDEVLEVYDELITEYDKEINVKRKKYISSRTSNKLLDIVKAAVILDGRKQAVFTDLFEVRYGLCTMNDEDDEETFNKVYKRCVEGLEDEKNQLAEIAKVEAELKIDEFKNVTLQASEFIERLKALASAQKKLGQLTTVNDNVEKRKKDFMEKLKTTIDETKQKLMYEVDK